MMRAANEPPSAPYEASPAPAYTCFSGLRSGVLVVVLPFRVAATVALFCGISVLSRVYLLLRRCRRRPTRRLDAAFSVFAGWTSRLLLKGVFGFRLVIRGRLVGAETLLAANHVAVYDGYAVMAGARTAVAFVARESYFRVPVVGAVLQALRVVGIDRRKTWDARRLILDAVLASPDRGWPLAVFPEGTTTNGYGVLPFKTGAFVGDVVRPVSLRYSCASGFDLSYTSNQMTSLQVFAHFLRTLLEPDKSIEIRLLPPLTRLAGESDAGFAERTRRAIAENDYGPDDDDKAHKFHLWEGWETADLRKAWFDERTSKVMD